MIGSALVFLGMALQSSGKVLYGTLLTSVSTPLFVAIGITLTAGVFLTLVRLRLPTEGRFTLLLLNLWTAISFICFFFALKHLPPAIFASIEIGTGLLTAVALAGLQERAWPRATRMLACLGIVARLCRPVLRRDRRHGVASGRRDGVDGNWRERRCRRYLGPWPWRKPEARHERLDLAVDTCPPVLSDDRSRARLAGALRSDDLSAGQRLAAWILIVAALVVLVPLLLFQLAVRRIDEVTFMVCVAAQPILTFIVSMPSPAYDWNTLTLVGVLIVTAFVGLDILTQRRAHSPATPDPSPSCSAPRAA